eukprot:SAG11_NODE_22042_length_413_cov_0.990446_2_plen_26_part_01
MKIELNCIKECFIKQCYPTTIAGSCK